MANQNRGEGGNNRQQDQNRQDAGMDREEGGQQQRQAGGRNLEGGVQDRKDDATDNTRQQGNLSSAIRLFVLDYFKSRAMAAQPDKVPAQ